MDHGLDIEKRVRDGLLRLGQGPRRSRCSRPTTPTTSTARTPTPTSTCSASSVAASRPMTRPQAVQASTATATTSSPPAEMRELWARQARHAGGLRQHPADRRALRRRVHRGQRHLHAARSRARRARPRTPGSSRRSRRGCGYRYPERHPRRGPQAAPTSRSASSPRWASPATSSSSPTSSTGPRTTASGSARAAARAPARWCAYAMRITDLDPLEHGLIFERFLNPDRVSMPDFDIDFDERRRGEVIRYVTEKYGDDRVSDDRHLRHDQGQAGGQGLQPHPRLPVRDGRPDHQGDARRGDGQGHPAQGDLRPRATSATARAASSARSTTADHDVKRVVDTAIGIEGLKRQWGVHAAGVIMSSEPLHRHHPADQAARQDGAIITQFDYPTCERLGLIKMDFLGLRNLTVLDDALEQHRGATAARRSSSRTSPLDDAATYAAARTRRHPRRLPARRRPDARPAALDAARQLRGHLRGRRALPARPDGRRLPQQVRPPQERPRADRADPPRAGRAARGDPRRDLRPDRLPGAGHGDRPEARRLHPRARPTCCAARWARRRRRSSTSEFGRFSGGHAERRLLRTRAIKTLWDILLPFSDYAFNKAHSAAYGLVSYWTAYLKANYPAEYMAALLTSVKDDKDKMAIYLNECRRMKIQVLPPDVNESDANFTPVGTRHPLRPHRDPQRRRQRRRRDRRGPRARRAASPTSTTSWTRSPALVCNKRVIESLVKAGAFDEMKHRRRALVADPRDGRRPVRRHQAQRGDRPGLPLRRPRRRRPAAASGSRSRSPRSTSGTR